MARAMLRTPARELARRQHSQRAGGGAQSLVLLGGVVKRRVSSGSEIPVTWRTEQPCQKSGCDDVCPRIRLQQKDGEHDMFYRMQVHGFRDGRSSCSRRRSERSWNEGSRWLYEMSVTVVLLYASSRQKADMNGLSGRCSSRKLFSGPSSHRRR